MENLYTVSRNKTRSDCFSDHELFMAKLRLKLKKVGTTIRPFRYDLNPVIPKGSYLKGMTLTIILRN